MKKRLGIPNKKEAILSGQPPFSHIVKSDKNIADQQGKVVISPT
jgi:hypothetical protein